MGGALTLAAMAETLKTAYLEPVKEMLNENAKFTFWRNQKPTQWVETELVWDSPLTFDFRRPHTPMGLHLVEVHWVEFDGEMMRRVENMDAYEVTLTATAILIPGKAGMPIYTINDILTQQAADAAKLGFKLAPAPWQAQPIVNVNDYPTTNLYSRHMLSGLALHSAATKTEKAHVLCNMAETVVKEMVGFLRPRVLAGASHDWLHDPEVSFRVPLKFKGVPLTLDSTLGVYPSHYKVFTKTLPQFKVPSELGMFKKEESDALG